MRRTACAILTAVALAFGAESVHANEASLRGSRSSMVRQNRVAKANDFTFLRTPDQVDSFVERGFLVPVTGDENYRTANVSYPFARPELRVFVERLARQYREGCGEPLVVTSLTRPRSEQPHNSHPLSVHPTGMAVDLRVPRKAECLSWLTGALLGLEASGVLDVTRERRPPHFHVAVFPDRYLEYAAPLIAADAREDSIRAAARARELKAQRTALKSAATAISASAVHNAAATGTAGPWAPLVVLVVAGITGMWIRVAELRKKAKTQALDS